MARIQIKRGLKANIPTSGMLVGEQHYATDRSTINVATSETTSLGVVPAVDDLGAIGAIDGASDLLMIHDASGTGVKEKKITIADFKTALNIPNGDTDEKVAVISGGTSGYLWGTDGTDGVLRMNSSMAMTKDSGNGFVTLAVGTVDLGTF
tara:strand:+ start:660 stop:1112 length:453 start_codon:yes stop_codon:yes gene_type:complete